MVTEDGRIQQQVQHLNNYLLNYSRILPVPVHRLCSLNNNLNCAGFLIDLSLYMSSISLFVDSLTFNRKIVYIIEILY